MKLYALAKLWLERIIKNTSVNWYAALCATNLWFENPLLSLLIHYSLLPRVKLELRRHRVEDVKSIQKNVTEILNNISFENFNHTTSVFSKRQSRKLLDKLFLLIPSYFAGLSRYSVSKFLRYLYTVFLIVLMKTFLNLYKCFIFCFDDFFKLQYYF